MFTPCVCLLCTCLWQFRRISKVYYLDKSQQLNSYTTLQFITYTLCSLFNPNNYKNVHDRWKQYKTKERKSKFSSFFYLSLVTITARYAASYNLLNKHCHLYRQPQQLQNYLITVTIRVKPWIFIKTRDTSIKFTPL